MIRHTKNKNYQLFLQIINLFNQIELEIKLNQIKRKQKKNLFIQNIEIN